MRLHEEIARASGDRLLIIVSVPLSETPQKFYPSYPQLCAAPFGRASCPLLLRTRPTVDELDIQKRARGSQSH